VIVCSVILGLFFPIVIFLSAIEAAVTDMAFFMDQMEKNDVIENTGIYPPDMEPVVDEIIAYLQGKRQDFDIKARIAPEDAKKVTTRVSIFNEKEITHMEDVQSLYLTALQVRDLAMILALGAFLILLKYRWRAIIKALFWGSAGFLVVFVLVGSCFVFNFTRTFILFHQLFFTNELWVMDPATDRLISIVPEPFFFALITRMVLYTMIPLGFTTIITAMVLPKTKTIKTKVS
jgi:integral membrane protein (TIGR01906 family)